MASRRRLQQALGKLVAKGGSEGDLVRRPPTPRTPQPPPVTTLSSPGQIADQQQAHGADMAPPYAAPPAPDAEEG